jgi:bacterioferritin (cytochrome b1)
MPREASVTAIFKPLQRKVLVAVLRQVVHNPGLHLFVLKNYHYVEEFGAAELRRVARLVSDPDLKGKLEQHSADEDKHALLFRQRILDLGGSPGLTPAEMSLAFFRRFDSFGLGISPQRFDEATPLEVAELIPFLVPLRVEEDTGSNVFEAHLQAADQDRKTQTMLAEILQDEHRHAAYLTEALATFGREGYQPAIDAAFALCRKHFKANGVPPEMKLRRLAAILEMYPYTPVGPAARLSWCLMSPLLWLARARARRSPGLVSS